MPTTTVSNSSIAPHSIERLKREAKAISRASGLSHSVALDQLASKHGFDNWSRLILQASDANQGGAMGLPASQTTPAQYVLQRTQDAMREAMRPWRSRPYPTAADIDDLSVRFVSPFNAVRYAISYMDLALKATRYLVTYKSISFIEMRNHLPYRLHETAVDGKWIMVNRHYKPVGSNRPDEWATYEDRPDRFFEISNSEAQAVSDPDHMTSHGLYGDGSTPWISRASATAYLSRLRRR